MIPLDEALDNLDQWVIELGHMYGSVLLSSFAYRLLDAVSAVTS